MSSEPPAHSHLVFAESSPSASSTSSTHLKPITDDSQTSHLTTETGLIDASGTHQSFLRGNNRRGVPMSDEQDSEEVSSDEEDWSHQGPHHIPHHLRRPSQLSQGDGSAEGLLGRGGPPSDGHHPHQHHDLHTPGGSTAKTMLFVFTVCNLLTYFDRGTISVCLTPMSKPEVFNLSNFQGGVLAGAYMFGYITASPVFAMMVRKYDPFRIIAFGLAVWACAALGCAASIGFFSLLFARVVSGIGEAAFLCIAPPFIDKCAPSAAKSRWMAIFYCAIPVGYALGFIVSGQWLNVYILPVYYQWRFIFVFEACAMLPFIMWCLATETPPNNFKDPPPAKQHRLDELNEPVSYRGPSAATLARRAAVLAQANAAQNGGAAAQPAQVNGDSLNDYMETVGEVLGNKVYMLIIFGYAAQTFVLGSVANFAVSYLINNFGFSIGRASSLFGSITVFVGVFGSLFGGWICDYLRRGKNKAHATAVTMKLAFTLISIAFPLSLLAFVKNSPEYFFTIFVLAEFILFATASPISSAVIWAVPFRLSPLACSLSIMFIHILGDAISPAIVGAILDATRQNWRLTMTCNTLWLVWSVIFWGWAWKAAEAKAKMIDEEMRQRGMRVDQDGHVAEEPASDHEQRPPSPSQIHQQVASAATSTTSPLLDESSIRVHVPGSIGGDDEQPAASSTPAASSDHNHKHSL